MGTMEISKMVQDLKELEAMAAEISAEMDTIKDKLKSEMDRRKIEEMSVGVFKVRYKSVTSKRFDSKAFKASHGDLYDRLVRENTTKRFSVS